MNEPMDVAEVARSVLGVRAKAQCPVCGADNPVMEPEDEIRALRAERDCLAERLRAAPDMREVIGQLRLILDGPRAETVLGLQALLHRLDRES